jgi:microcystin-dependent protein
MSAPFIAEIRMFGFTFPPRGSAFCNGQIFAIAQNTALFSLLGTTYGGNGTTNFALPNLQGRAVMHPGTGPGLSPRFLGELGGSPTVTLLSGQVPAHSHGVVVAATADASADRANAAGNVMAKPADSSYSSSGAAALMNTGGVTPTGQNGAHNNMQPYLAINFCIALQGIFPARN